MCYEHSALCMRTRVLLAGHTFCCGVIVWAVDHYIFLVISLLHIHAGYTCRATTHVVRISIFIFVKHQVQCQSHRLLGIPRSAHLQRMQGTSVNAEKAGAALQKAQHTFSVQQQVSTCKCSLMCALPSSPTPTQ